MSELKLALESFDQVLGLPKMTSQPFDQCIFFSPSLSRRQRNNLNWPSSPSRSGLTGASRQNVVPWLHELWRDQTWLVARGLNHLSPQPSFARVPLPLFRCHQPVVSFWGARSGNRRQCLFPGLINAGNKVSRWGRQGEGGRSRRKSSFDLNAGIYLGGCGRVGVELGCPVSSFALSSVAISCTRWQILCVESASADRPARQDSWKMQEVGGKT